MNTNTTGEALDLNKLVERGESIAQWFDRANMRHSAEGVRGLIALARAGSAAPAGEQDLTACANCLRPKCEHNGKLCPAPYTTHWHAWDYADQQQPTYPGYAAPLPTKEGASEQDAVNLPRELVQRVYDRMCKAQIFGLASELRAAMSAAQAQPKDTTKGQA